MVYLTRVEHFNAAHKLYNPEWSREQNDEVFGKCANDNWHGHNFEIHVTVKGEPDPNTGFIIDVKKLSIIRCAIYGGQNVQHRSVCKRNLEAVGATYLWRQTASDSAVRNAPHLRGLFW
jgi:6-pyruvoyl-tetrahydropterin synthase